jgi:hypothetical protein
MARAIKNLVTVCALAQLNFCDAVKGQGQFAKRKRGAPERNVHLGEEPTTRAKEHLARRFQTLTSRPSPAASSTLAGLGQRVPPVPRFPQPPRQGHSPSPIQPHRQNGSSSSGRQNGTSSTHAGPSNGRQVCGVGHPSRHAPRPTSHVKLPESWKRGLPPAMFLNDNWIKAHAESLRHYAHPVKNPGGDPGPIDLDAIEKSATFSDSPYQYHKHHIFVESEFI